MREGLNLVDISIFNRIFLRINYLHMLDNIFNFGINLSSEPQTFAIYKNKEQEDEPTYTDLQETKFDIWLGIISFHIGWREKW